MFCGGTLECGFRFLLGAVLPVFFAFFSAGAIHPLYEQKFFLPAGPPPCASENHCGTPAAASRLEKSITIILCGLL
jgi:hypothetical protein